MSDLSVYIARGIHRAGGRGAEIVLAQSHALPPTNLKANYMLKISATRHCIGKWNSC